MTLNRLGVRGKLNLLLLLPLIAVLVVAIPFVASQVQNTRSAAITADTARQARQLGALVWELQRERLLTAGYLASPAADNVTLMLQQRMVVDTAEAVRGSLDESASDELRQALVRLDSIAELRQAALRRGVSLDSVARTFHAVIGAVIDALRLVPQRTSDAEGTRQLTAIEALLRANEQGALRGMAVITAAVSPQVGRTMLNDATAQAQMFTERFVQQADVEHSALVVLVDQGEAARRVNGLAARLPEVRPDTLEVFVAEALAGSESQASLRRLVQDRVTSEITNAAAARANSAEVAAWTVGLGISLLFVLVMVLTMAVSRSIALPLQRLTKAATTVADLANTELVRVSDTESAHEQPPRLAAIDVTSTDELGDLAKAFNRVQATAALLLERQMVTRRNVSLMFSNVAQRTQNLVNRQLQLVDELERNEQDVTLLASLYRLDHLSTRLRRNAENLLVIAGARDETRIAGPTALATTLRSALAEIEDYQRVRFHSISEVTIPSPLSSDLVLIFAELLENATAFSPPESFVDVGAELISDGSCRVSIVDQGIGIAPERLEQENRRLVERERLDIAPTSVLGLFVVGRLARRYGLTVALVPTAGGGITAHLGIPSTLYSHGAISAPTPARPLTTVTRRPAILPPVQQAIQTPADGFEWFVTGPADANDYQRAVGTATVAMPVLESSSRGGLNRRVPGAQLPLAGAASDNPAPAAVPRHDAAAARDSMDAFQSAVARAAAAAPLPSTESAPVAMTPTPAWPPMPAPAPAQTAGRNGLARRVPGASLAPGLLDQPTKDDGQRTWQSRDPDAARAAFDGYSSGLAQAADQMDSGLRRHDSHQERKK